MGISIYTFRSPIELLRVSYVCHFITPSPDVARPSDAAPLPLASAQPPATASPPRTATEHVQPTEQELATLHMRRTATNLTQLEIERIAAPPADVSNATSAPISPSSADAATSLGSATAPVTAPAVPAALAAIAASKGPEPESLESPSSVVVQLHLGPVVLELDVGSHGSIAGGRGAEDLV